MKQKMQTKPRAECADYENSPGGDQGIAHIRDKRSECRQHSQQDKQEYFGIIVVHNTLLNHGKITPNYSFGNSLLLQVVVHFRHMEPIKIPELLWFRDFLFGEI